MSEPVVVDMSALYALLSASDINHERARRAFLSLLDADTDFIVPSYVLVESAALVQARMGLDAAKTLMETVRSAATIFWVEEGVHWEAWDLLVGRSRRKLSLVDCATIVVARSLDAPVFAFDEDFLVEGLKVIPAEEGVG